MKEEIERERQIQMEEKAKQDQKFKSNIFDTSQGGAAGDNFVQIKHKKGGAASKVVHSPAKSSFKAESVHREQVP